MSKSLVAKGLVVLALGTRSAVTVFSLFVVLAGAARAIPPDIITQLDATNVSWTTPGPTAMESMPIGNGDIGLNVWVEAGGALNFYISKTDAWSENYSGDNGMYKLGGVRVSLSPNPLTGGAAFNQTLKVRTGEITISEGATTIRVWVDASNPVVRVEIASPQAVTATATLNNWRGDPVVTGQANKVVWYHRNPSGADVNLRDRTFGAAIFGTNFTSQNSTTLVSTAGTSHVLSIVPLTTTTATTTQWLDQLNQKVTQVSALNLAATRTAHQAWWDQFWDRSWIFARGNADAASVTRGHVLQRFITACGGRGAYPIKFNGSIFVVENAAAGRSQDSRAWGGRYWFQNTRSPYWPRLMAGDFEMMLPLFQMYSQMLTANAAVVTGYYGHTGAYFAETSPFWGGLGYWGPEVPEDWTGHYFSPVLELTMMMLDYYEYTGDATFAQQTLVPAAKAGLQFYNAHFTRDAQGKLLLDPVNSIETFWKVYNPAPDIAGLQAVLKRMLALPTSLVDAPTRSAWTTLQGQLPVLPTGTKAGNTVLLPYSGPQTAQSRNGENPELYAVFPYRIFGIGKQGLKMATDSFNSRNNTFYGGWSQDPIQAAMLGLTEVARSYVLNNFTAKEPRLKFPAFWADQHDYAPNQCTGGNAEYALQNMIMQTDNGKILLLPAWPRDWAGDFKLRAPGQTTVQGSIANGKVTNLMVTPSSRAADVIDMSSLSAEDGVGYKLVSTQDDVVPIKQTVKGGANVLAVSGDFGGSGNSELVTGVRDANLDTKYFNKAQQGANPKGVNTGFVIKPKLGATIVTGIRLASANDMESRDPRTITVEGSNAANADQAGGNGYQLIYEGPSGLVGSSDRKAWGLAASFSNANAYAFYRVLVTSTNGGASSDATQYSEAQLTGAAQNPLPGNNIVSTSDVVLALKQTVKGGPNVAAVSGTDFGAGESATNLRDGNLGSKYFNKGKDGTSPAGVNTGYVIRPAAGAKAVNGFQFGTGNDMPNRDPVTITIEGSNAANAAQVGGNGFVLLWEGASGLAVDPGRQQWGQRVSFWNTTAYTTYRILIRKTWQPADGAQYSDVRLFAP